MRSVRTLTSRLALVAVLLAALGGCGTSITVGGTYADVWSAVSRVVESAVRDRGPEQGPPRAFAGKGTIEAVGRGPLDRGELHYWVTVEPTLKPGKLDEPADRKVTILVRQLDTPSAADEGSDAEPAVAARRRRDIERSIASEIERRIDRE
jgi:hypothetical protein